jgi:redox-sensitive bicupin YhaK (pirin superfamily)
MSAPAYQEFSPSDTPLEKRQNGTQVRVISGITNEGTRGVVKNEYVKPTYLDVSLPAGESFQQTVDATDNAFLFVIEGGLKVGENDTPLDVRMLGILGKGSQIVVSAEESSRFLLVSAQALKEPVARGGPFVMNSKEEIIQAFEDYKHNRF